MAAELIYENRQRDGRTDDERDMTKLIVSFHNFTSTPEKAFVISLFPEWRYQMLW